MNSLQSAHNYDPNDKYRRVIEVMPAAHLEALKDDERVESLETGKARIKDYAFSRGFSFVLEKSSDKSRKRYNFRCQRHGNKTRNYRKLKKVDRKRPNTKIQFNECPCKVKIS